MHEIMRNKDAPKIALAVQPTRPASPSITKVYTNPRWCGGRVSLGDLLASIYMGPGKLGDAEELGVHASEITLEEESPYLQLLDLLSSLVDNYFRRRRLLDLAPRATSDILVRNVYIPGVMHGVWEGVRSPPLYILII